MIFLSCSCGKDQRPLLEKVASAIKAEGYDVYVPFEIKIEDAWGMSQEVWARKVFEKDVEALDKCDTYLMITPGRNSTAGTNWESGYAYAKDKRMIVVQYTDDETSLMTFCSAKNFLNSSEETLVTDVLEVLKEFPKVNNCKTVLT